MARVTVEDCIEKVSNRFELVALASQRAKSIAAGAPITVERDNDKNAVIALREIAGDKVDTATLREELTQRNQRYSQAEEAPVQEEESSEFSKEIRDLSHEGGALDDDELSASDDSEEEGEALFAEDNLDVDD